MRRRQQITVRPTDPGPVDGMTGEATIPGRRVIASPGAACPSHQQETNSRKLDMTAAYNRSLRLKALERVEENKGAPGIDGMTTQELRPYLTEIWSTLRVALFNGTYQPQPVRRVTLRKPDGGERLLGIPCVLDRWIQQCLKKVLEPLFEPQFSTFSFGFRPKRKAQEAVKLAQEYVKSGYHWVVDIDLKSFFDRINHDILMARVARKVTDKVILRLIRSFLESGVMLSGVKVRTEEGAPQGGPLSPLLANILLDDLDKELEKRGLHFVRYADDCNIYVKSRRAGLRVMESVTRFLETKLKLQVNADKSAVDEPWNRKFLGFTIIRKSFKLLPAPKSCQRFKTRVRELTNSRRSQSLKDRIKNLNQYVRGWYGYYRLSEISNVFEELDGWIRRRLRACVWRTWKLIRTRIRELLKLRLPKDAAIKIANTRKGPWRIAGSPPVQRALSNAHWKGLGLFSLSDGKRPLVNAR